MPLLLFFVIFIVIFLCVTGISLWSKRFLTDMVIVFLITLPLYAITLPAIGFLPHILPAEWFPFWMHYLIIGFYATLITIPLSLSVGFVFAIIETIQSSNSEMKSHARQRIKMQSD